VSNQALDTNDTSIYSADRIQMVINYLINYMVADFGLGLPCATPTPSPVITLPVLDFPVGSRKERLAQENL
jgi:hypothetical protein